MNFTNSTSYALIPSDYPLLVGQPIVLVATVFVMVLMCVFRNQNPLKSRGFLPLLSMIIYFLFVLRILLKMLSVFQTYTPNSLTSNFKCYWFILPQAPLLCNVFLILSFNMLKFILTNFLIQKQDEIWKVQDNVHELKKRGSSDQIPGLEQIEAKTEAVTKRLGILIKVIKIVLSGWVSTTISILYFIFWIVVEIIILNIGEKAVDATCIVSTPKGRTIMTAMMIGSIIIFSITFIFATIVFIVDIALHLLKNRGCDCSDYIKEDPLFFRLEFIMIYFPFTLIFIALTIESFGSSLYANVVIEWLPKIAIFFAQFLLLYFFGGNVLLITIIKKIRESKKNIDPSDLIAVLGDKQGKTRFASFCKKEWSQENILLYNEIQKYKELSLKHKRKRCFEIYSTYISTNSPIEANLSSEVREQLHTRISTYKEDEAELWDKLFDDVEFETIKNLKDTFMRFTSSTTYKDWAKTLK